MKSMRNSWRESVGQEVVLKPDSHSSTDFKHLPLYWGYSCDFHLAFESEKVLSFSNFTSLPRYLGLISDQNLSF
jgi:hypothetical protein